MRYYDFLDKEPKADGLVIIEGTETTSRSARSRRCSNR